MPSSTHRAQFVSIRLDGEGVGGFECLESHTPTKRGKEKEKEKKKDTNNKTRKARQAVVVSRVTYLLWVQPFNLLNQLVSLLFKLFLLTDFPGVCSCTSVRVRRRRRRRSVSRVRRDSQVWRFQHLANVLDLNVVHICFLQLWLHLRRDDGHHVVFPRLHRAPPVLLPALCGWLLRTTLSAGGSGFCSGSCKLGLPSLLLRHSYFVLLAYSFFFFPLLCLLCCLLHCKLRIGRHQGLQGLLLHPARRWPCRRSHARAGCSKPGHPHPHPVWTTQPRRHPRRRRHSWRCHHTWRCHHAAEHTGSIGALARFVAAALYAEEGRENKGEIKRRKRRRKK